jgi:hypothetical protein
VVGGALIGARWGVTGVATAVLIAILINYLLMASLSLRIVGLSWPAFAGAHVRGALLGVAVGALAVAISTALRARDAADLVVLVITAGGTLTPILLVILKGPRWAMGDDLRWLLTRFVLLARGGSGARR